MILPAAQTYRMALYLVLISYPLASVYLARIPVIICAVAMVVIIIFSTTARNSRLFDLMLTGKWLILFSIISLFSIRSPELATIVGTTLPVMVFLLIGKSYSPNQELHPQQFLRLLFATCWAVFGTCFLILVKFGNLRATNAIEKDFIGAFSNSVVDPCIVGMIFAVLCFKYTKRARYLVFILLCLILLLLTKSRTALLLCGISLVFGASLLSTRKGKIRPIYFLGVASSLFVILISASFALPSVTDLIMSTVGRFSSVGNLSIILGDTISVNEIDEDVSRTVQYYAALQVIQENPWTGIGHGSFKALTEEHFGKSVSVHNMFLKGWVSIGITGLLLQLALFAAVAKQLGKLRRRAKSVGMFYLADFYTCGMVTLLTLFVQAQFRGMWGDYFFLFIISSFLVFGQRALSRNTMSEY